MIALLGGWTWMGLLSLGLGGPLLCLFHPPKSLSSGPRFFLSLWLGLFAWGTIFLAACAVVPLRPWLGLAALVLSCALFLHPSHPAREWLKLFPACRVWLISALIIPLLLLPVCLQPVTNTDSVSYHYDLIAWMSRLGSVPGLALIHARFAFISIWFTFPAILNQGPLEARMTGVANGFAAVIATGQIFWTAVRFLNGTCRRDHLFAGVGLFLAIVFPTLLNITAAPPHDYPVGIVIVLTAWSLLLSESTRSGPWRYLPIVLASFAITLKLSSLPVLAVAGLVQLCRQPDKVRFFLTSAVIGGGLILPWIINQILISAWPLFPLGVSFPLPWAVPVEETTWQANRIRQYAPWPHLETDGAMGTFQYWLAFDRTHPPALLYLLAALLTSCGLWLRRKTLAWHPAPLFALGGAGTLFWLYTTAHPRFGWGYLAILPAAAALLLPESRIRFRMPTSIAASSAWAGILLTLVVPTFLIPTRTETMLANAAAEGVFPEHKFLPLVRPPVIPNIRYPEGSDTAVYYEHPLAEKNLMPMDARPLYHKIELGNRLQLRKPDRGLRGGFIFKTPPSESLHPTDDMREP